MSPLRIIYAIFFILKFASCLDLELNLLDKYKDGENRYRELVVKSYGSCWHEALSNLHSGCKELTEEVQSRLALSFTNCFLRYAGSEMCLCPADDHISNCLRNSSDRVFSTYTEFYTHTQSICHYLQHREWLKQTERTVMRLSENAQAVTEKLDQSKESLLQVIDLQEKASHEHQQLFFNGRKLNDELLKSQYLAKTVYGDFKTTAMEQNVLLHAVFDRVKILQNLVLGEFTTIYTVAYFIMALFITYLLTSLPQTANARFWLTKLFCINGIVEYLITGYYLNDEITNSIFDASGPIYSRISVCRKVTCFVGFLILAYTYKTYKNYEVINNKLLEEIRLQNRELQQVILSRFSPIKLTSTPINFPGRKTVSTIGKDMLEQLTSKQKSADKISETNFPVPLESETSLKKSLSKISEINSPVPVESETSLKKSLSKKKTTKTKSNTPKKNLILSSIENLNETESAQKRYNLRSRMSSPISSPLNGMSHSTPKSEGPSFLR